MSQAKGILARRREDTQSLYRNPRMCGYFVGVKLRPDIDRDHAERWFATVSGHIDALVARLVPESGQEEGDKVAAVAVGLAPGFFLAGGQPRFDPPVQVPAGFDPGTAESPNPLPWESPVLASVTHDDADIMFYIASVFEARVAQFVDRIASTAPDVASLSVARGYQRVDGTEPFGYQDGVRNMPKGVRSEQVFVHTETAPEEPTWVEGGSYMTFLRIVQHAEAFAKLGDQTSRDNVIGRQPSGTRLDLVGQRVQPRAEPREPTPNLPAASHVGKAGPRGHRDDTQIFRRGLPFMEVADGHLHVGLNFASFQASLDQFDTVINDWMLSTNFPTEGAGVDALFDPGLGLTTFERIGLYFVPPHSEDGLAASIFATPAARRTRQGRLVVRKRVTDPADPGRRFERGGFVFRITDSSGQQVGADFTSASSGRAVFGGRLELGATYTLHEVSAPVQNVTLTPVSFEMTHPNQQIRVVNTVTQPNTPYGRPA
jgi:deferrochelatase/peroxidase EfeB